MPMKRFTLFLFAALVAAISFAQGPKAHRAMATPAELTTLKLPVARTLTTHSLPTTMMGKRLAKSMTKVIRKDVEVAPSYVRVNTVPESWDGEYLIVFEGEEATLAMNGGLETLDAANNSIEVSVEDYEIASTETTDAASFTIVTTEEGYTIKSKSGFFIGRGADSNGLDAKADEALLNDLSVDSEGFADVLASGGAHLRFNSASNQMRFCYYKSATYTAQQPIALYKKGGEKTELVVPEMVELPEDLETEDYAMVGVMMVGTESGWQESAINKTVQVGKNEADIYIQGLSQWFPDAWVKGTIVDNQVVIPSNQLFGEDEYGPDVFVAFENVSEEDYAPAENLVFTLDAEGVMTMQNWYGEAETANNKTVWNYCEDLTLTPGEAEMPELVVLPEGLTPTSYVLTGVKITGWDENYQPVSEEYEGEAQVAIDGTDVYIQGLCEYLPESWVKGTLNGSTVVVPTGQYFGDIMEQYFMYFVGYSGATGVGNVTFTMDENGTLSTEDWILINSTVNSLAYYHILTDATLTAGEMEQPEVVVVPEGLTFTQYNLNGQSLTYEYDEEDDEAEPTPVYSDVFSVAQVAFDGSDVYIQGLSYDLMPEAYVKGTLADGVITIPSGQYLGAYWGYYDMFFVGYANDKFTDLHFAVSGDGNTLEAQEWFGTSGSATDEEYLYDILTEGELTKTVEKAGMPAAPSVVDFDEYDEEDGFGGVELDIPLTDVDGNGLLVSKLSYKLYVEEAGEAKEYTFTTDLYKYVEADMVEVPYTFRDDYDFEVVGSMVYVYLNAPTQSYDKIGVQSIYRGGDVENKTEISWYLIDRSAIRGLGADKQSDDVIYNLAGQRVERAVKGIYIQNGKKIVVK